MLSGHASGAMDRQWPGLAWYSEPDGDDDDFGPLDPKQLDMRTFNPEPRLRRNIVVFLRDPLNKQLYWSGFVTFPDSQGNDHPACACCGAELEDGLECRLGEAVLAESLDQELQFAMNSTLQGKRTAIVAEYAGYFGDHTCEHKLMGLLRLIGEQYQRTYRQNVDAHNQGDSAPQNNIDYSNVRNLN